MGPVLGFAGAIIFGAGAGASAAYVLAVNLARLAVLSLVSKALAPKIDLTRSAADKLLTVRSTVQPQAFVYGQDMISGPLIFANTAGEGNKELHRVVALTGREIESIEGFRIDDYDVALSDLDTNGLVVSGQFADAVEIDWRLGTSTQTAFADMLTAFPSNWTSAHRGRGWSMIYTKMTIIGNNDAFEAGTPQNLRALVKGHKVYDPRLDSTTTSGSGSHRVDDDTTWEWSSNPALCLADFLLFEDIGMGEDPDRIDYDLVAAAADVCDEQVLIPPASPSTFQNRYTCNFTYYSDQDRGQIVEMLTTSMMGRLVFSQGQWRMWAGEALAATVTLSEANLAGPLQLQASTPSDNRYNRVRGKFVDPSRNYTANPYPEQRNSNYETDDNEIKYKTFDINTCNNSYEAQRNAIIRLRQSRMQQVLTFPCNWSGFRVQPGTTVSITLDELGFTDAKFFVTEWTLDKEGKGVNLTMVQEDDDVWDDPDVSDYSTRTSTGDLIFQNQGGLIGAEIINEREGLTTYAGVNFGADGQLYYQLANGNYSAVSVPSGQWRGSYSGDLWIRVTINSGTLDSDLDSNGFDSSGQSSWIQLDQDVAISISQSSVGSNTASVTVDLSDTAFGASIVETADYYLSATVTAGLVQLAGTQPEHTQADVNSTVYAGVLFNSAGDEFYYNATGSPLKIQDWRLDGDADDYWMRIEVIDSTDTLFGTYTGDWQTMDASVWARLQNTNVSTTDTAELLISIATDDMGSNIIAQKTYLLSATRQP